MRLITAHRASGDVTVPCERDKPQLALREALHTLDLGMPVWLPRHQSDWNAFGLAHFTQDHFMEAIRFDRMEISYIAPDQEPKVPKTSDLYL